MDLDTVNKPVFTLNKNTGSKRRLRATKELLVEIIPGKQKECSTLYNGN